MMKGHPCGQRKGDGRDQDEENCQNVEFQRAASRQEFQARFAYQRRKERREEWKQCRQDSGQREIAARHFCENGNDRRKRCGGQEQHADGDVRRNLEQTREHEGQNGREDEVERQDPAKAAATEGSRYLAPRQPQTHGEQQTSERGHRQQPDRGIGIKSHSPGIKAQDVL